MKTQDTKSNDNGSTPNDSIAGQNDIRSRLRKNPNKTKHLYTDELNEKKTKKKSDTTSPPNEKEICRAILEIVKKDEKSFLFRQPAIRAFTTQKDKEYYKKQIKEPRDLGGITKKLKMPKYSAKEFYEDMELCWSNAQLFNENSTEVYQNAVYLKDLCNKLYKEKGLFDIINKEKEREKEKEKEIDSNTNNNTNESNTSFNEKNENINKENKDKANKTKEKSDNSSNSSNKTSSANNSESNNNDSSYSDELKSNKMIGKKRKRQKNSDDKNNEKIKIENKPEGEKKLLHKRGRKKKDKHIADESVEPIPITQNKNKTSFEDIKKRFPINFPVISNIHDIDKISQRRKSNSLSRGNNSKGLFKINSTYNNNSNNKSFANYHTTETHLTKRKAKYQNQNNNYNNINQNKTYSGINIDMIDEKDKRRIAYEFIMEIFKKNFPIDNPDENQKTYEINNQKYYYSYDPERYKVENKQMAKYDNNCSFENLYKMDSKNQKKRQSQQQELYNKNNNKLNNSQNINNSVNINNNGVVKSVNNGNNLVRIMDSKEEKKMQSRIEIAKYFDILCDNNMIDMLVFLENIRPQAIRTLDNDTIYIDMEAFNEETFNKLFDFVKKFV